MATSEAKLAAFAKLLNDPQSQAELLAILEAELADPYAHSALSYWLHLEVWDREEGIQVLTGVEPGTVSMKQGPYAFDDPSLFDDPWTNAQPFQYPGFSALPPPDDDDWIETSKCEEQRQLRLEAREERRAVLSTYHARFRAYMHKLDHSPSALGEPVSGGQWRPVAFISWSLRIGLKPEWYDWADSNHALPDSIDPMAAPFLDADAPEYPRLLAIALRAWSAAKSGKDGTPKLRILNFLDLHYPEIPKATKKAIATVANWKKEGGRPPRNR